MEAPGQASERVLEVAGLDRTFGERTVLRDVHLNIDRGERVAVTGRNGSGKTTLIRCIAGTLTPTGGRIRIGAHDAGSIEARRRMGCSLSQERSFYLRLTGHANLLFFSRLCHTGEQDARRAVGEVIDELDLAEIAAERASRCSTGMIQQLAFARALLGHPDLLLLDEPTRSLDPEAIARLWAAIERRRDTATLIATHRSDDVDRCDRRFALGAD